MAWPPGRGRHLSKRLHLFSNVRRCGCALRRCTARLPLLALHQRRPSTAWLRPQVGPPPKTQESRFPEAQDSSQPPCLCHAADPPGSLGRPLVIMHARCIVVGARTAPVAAAVVAGPARPAAAPRHPLDALAADAAAAEAPRYRPDLECRSGRRRRSSSRAGSPPQTAPGLRALPGTKVRCEVRVHSALTTTTS